MYLLNQLKKNYIKSVNASTLYKLNMPMSEERS